MRAIQARPKNLLREFIFHCGERACEPANMTLQNKVWVDTKACRGVMDDPSLGPRGTYLPPGFLGLDLDIFLHNFY